MVPRHEVEILRRSIAMLTPGAPALDREQAMEVLAELHQVQRRLEELRAALQRLVDEAG